MIFNDDRNPRIPEGRRSGDSGWRMIGVLVMLIALFVIFKAVLIAL